jgi:multidrug efflux system membrane fusion protein
MASPYIMTKFSKLLATACLLPGTWLLQGCSGRAERAAPAVEGAPVLVATARLQDVPIEVHAIGNIEPVTTITVRSQVNGELSRIFFAEGDSVRKGQTLFLIDDRPYKTQVGQAEANLARDSAQLRQSKANLARDMAQQKFAGEQAQRYSELSAQGVLSRMQSDQMQSDADMRVEAVQADKAAIESAEAAIDADKAALDRARLEMGYCTISSPIDGRTGTVSLKPGNLVTANGTELTTIHQVQPINVVFSVPEKFLPDIRKYMATRKLEVFASRRDDPSPPAQGFLSFVDNSVDASTGGIKLKASFTNDDRKLWPGQFVNATIRLSTRPSALIVPVQAVQTGPEKQFVFVVNHDMKVEMRNVKVGPQIDQEVVIESGLRPGEMVVTEGQIRLTPGRLVAIQKAR